MPLRPNKDAAAHSSQNCLLFKFVMAQVAEVLVNGPAVCQYISVILLFIGVLDTNAVSSEYAIT